MRGYRKLPTGIPYADPDELKEGPENAAEGLSGGAANVGSRCLSIQLEENHARLLRAVLRDLEQDIPVARVVIDAIEEAL